MRFLLAPPAAPLGVATFLLFSLPGLAQAQTEPPITAGVLQLGGGFRYGVDLADMEPNPWGVGLGLELGYTMHNAVYLGGVFDYFFGGTLEGPGSEVRANVWQLAVEGGYDLQLLDWFVLRPKLGVGLSTLRAEVCAAGCQSDSESKLGLAPGVTALFIWERFSLSFDARYQMVFAEEEMLRALIFSVGFGF